MSYSDYLQSEHWRETREEKLSDVGRCENCGKAMGLEVHHLTYDNLGSEGMEDLQVLCALCHRRTHGLVPKGSDFKRTGGGTLYGRETIRYQKGGA